MQKRYLFIFQKPAYCGLYVQEMLDELFTIAAFEQSVCLLLIDAGVLHLKTSQHASVMGEKNILKLFSMLETLDVNDIYVETESLEQKKLSKNDLFLNVKTILRNDISQFIQQFDCVITV